MEVEEILESDEIPNEKQTATLNTSLEQIEVKKGTIEELDAKIYEAIQDPDALEAKILYVENIQFNIVEKITLIKAALARSRPLNLQAAPFQPQHFQVQSAQEPPLDDWRSLLNEDEKPLREETPVKNMLHDETTDGGITALNETSSQQQGHYNTFRGISQNVSHLPKLTLSIFEGNSLAWQIFWDTLNLLCTQTMC